MSLSKTYRILVADDDHDILAALKLLLGCEGYEVVLASRPEQALKLFKAEHFDLVFLDLNFQRDTTSGEEGLALISDLRKLDAVTPIIVMTGWASVNIAVATMQQGANDFIEKPWENERVLSIVNTQLSLAQERHQSQKLSQENQLLKADSGRFEPLVAESSAMRKVMQQVEQIAQSDIAVLITGENGTGKSLLAQHIHHLSARSQNSLINVNMGAISESLFESEMFGHVKGAFTDAKENRIGRFELADQGSLFLDEIGNIPLSQQGKLLRVLESQEFEKVGGSKTQSSNARIISATNADIPALISEGQFRQDLYYRLNSIEIALPALRERKEDILILAQNFLAKYAQKYHKEGLSFSPSVDSALLNYAWPGNVRELSHMIERAVILSAQKQLGTEVFTLGKTAQPSFEPESTTVITGVDVKSCSLEEIEKYLIAERIQYHQGNMQAAAKSLGLSRSAFYRRIDKYQL